MAQSQTWQRIPISLTLEHFEEFALSHLPKGSRGSQPKLSLHEIFNYILKLLYLGCQRERVAHQDWSKWGAREPLHLHLSRF
jgi:hypothetical protein